MKRHFGMVLVRMIISVAILWGVEYLYGSCVIQEVITKQDSLVWIALIGGGSLVALMGIGINHLLNKFLYIDANPCLFVNIAGAVVASVFWVIIGVNSKQTLLHFDSYETDYLLMLILSLFVFAGSIVEGIIYRIYRSK